LGCAAAGLEKLEHDGAGVDCVGVEEWLLVEEVGEEAAVSVTED
jgi:hypothetical protein